jgi:protein-disulfide isomerase
MQARVKLLASIPDSETIVFQQKGKLSGVFTIFVDPDCTRCAQLFADTAQITAEGNKVRYVLTMDSDISRRIWCSADRAAALKAAFQAGDRGRSSLPKCATSFTTRFAKTSQSLGVSATPTTFTDRGRVLVGYISIPSMLYNIDETYIFLVEELRKLP